MLSMLLHCHIICNLLNLPACSAGIPVAQHIRNSCRQPIAYLSPSIPSLAVSEHVGNSRNQPVHTSHYTVETTFLKKPIFTNVS